MLFKVIITSKSSKAKCMGCKEPILKKEGVIKWTAGFYCYNCSLKYLKRNIIDWKHKIKL